MTRFQLEAEHGQFADEQETADEHNEEIDGAAQCLMYGRNLVEIGETNPEDGIGGGGQSDEGERLTLVDVELCQTKCRECCHNEGKKGEPAEWHRMGAKDVEAKHRGSDAERNDISQRIELLANRTRDVHGTCGESVEKVENGTTKDEQTGKANLSGESEIDGEATAIEVAARHYVGEVNQFQLTMNNKQLTILVC